MDDVDLRRIVRYCKCITGTEKVMQIRMDADIRESVEKIYEELGISFEDAVRVFAVQSIMKKGWPFGSKTGKE